MWQWDRVSAAVCTVQPGGFLPATQVRSCSGILESLFTLGFVCFFFFYGGAFLLRGGPLRWAEGWDTHPIRKG